jgi:hypothetical protein
LSPLERLGVIATATASTDPRLVIATVPRRASRKRGIDALPTEVHQTLRAEHQQRLDT